VWHVDKYKITFKLVINLINEILYHTVVSSGLSRPGIIDARVRYRAAAGRLRNTALYDVRTTTKSPNDAFIRSIPVVKRRISEPRF